MSVDQSGLSPVQRRYLELTEQCNLEYEEALHALGRRSGGLPEYRQLSRLEQFNKIHELIGSGLTQEEGERVVGIFRDKKPTVQVQQSSGTGSSFPPTKQEVPRWSPKQSCAGEPLVRCYRCQKSDSTLVQIEGGAWICKKCRKQLKAARKAEHRRREAAAIYAAIAHPELRGLRGIRKWIGFEPRQNEADLIRAYGPSPQFPNGLALIHRLVVAAGVVP